MGANIYEVLWRCDNEDFLSCLSVMDPAFDQSIAYKWTITCWSISAFDNAWVYEHTEWVS